MTTNDPVPEQYLILPGGRKIAYAEAGNPSSSILVLHFHGYLSIGFAFRPPQTLLKKDVHYVAPTLPGWGKTSPRRKAHPYNVELIADITALIDHLHPDDYSLKIYLSGISFGTAAAQMLYGAPFDVFPHGRNIAGCLLQSPNSPYRLHKDYSKTLGLAGYIMFGPPAYYAPFNLVFRFFKFMLGFNLNSLEGAERMMRRNFDQMDVEERAAWTEWERENGRPEGSTEKHMAEMMMESVKESWAGFLEGLAVLCSDWGFEPDVLDDEHNSRPILVVASVDDTNTPIAMAEWIESKYKNVSLQRIKGSHWSTMFHDDEAWKKLLESSGM